MSRAAVSELIAVGGGITTDLMRSGYVGARVRDVRIHRREQWDDAARSDGRWRGGRHDRGDRNIPVRMTVTQ